MAVAVDVCRPASVVELASPTATEWTCAACGEAFGSSAEQRSHCKSERHVYNTKRRVAGLKPISAEAWERKLRESRNAAGAAGADKGTAHLKAGKAHRKASGDESSGPADSAATRSETPAAEREPWTPNHCLFDNQRFRTLETCLKYMSSKYSFVIPEVEYCTDVPGLLGCLWRKMSEPPYACIYCNRRFPDAGSVRRHMLDKKHTRIGTEAKTRTGNICEVSTEELQAELEDYYDYHASTREITQRIRDPMQKAGSLLRYFDKDRDGYLHYDELAALWAATSDGAELSKAMYAGACKKAGADPEKGLDEEDLARLYAQEFADLDAHFRVLEDLLAQSRASRSGDKKDETKAVETIAEGQDEDGEDEEETHEGADNEDADGAESDGSSDTEIVECEGEDEFQEVMRILGLQPATVLDNGDLRLPNGSVAGHRDLNHIFRQRGQHFGQTERPSKPVNRLAIGFGMSGKECTSIQLAMSHRAQVREGKKVLAVLRKENWELMKLGVAANNLQKSKSKIKTGRGDFSMGR